MLDGGHRVVETDQARIDQAHHRRGCQNLCRRAPREHIVRCARGVLSPSLRPADAESAVPSTTERKAPAHSDWLQADAEARTDGMRAANASWSDGRVGCIIGASANIVASVHRARRFSRCRRRQSAPNCESIRRHRLPGAALRNSTTTSARNDAQQLAARAAKAPLLFGRIMQLSTEEEDLLPRALGITARDAPGETPPACRRSPRRDIWQGGGARGRGRCAARSAANRVGGAARAARAGVPAAAVDVHRGTRRRQGVQRAAHERQRAQVRRDARSRSNLQGDLLRRLAHDSFGGLCSAAHAGAGKGLRGRRAVSASSRGRRARPRARAITIAPSPLCARPLSPSPDGLITGNVSARSTRGLVCSELCQTREQVDRLLQKLASNIFRAGERRPHEWWWR